MKKHSPGTIKSTDYWLHQKKYRDILRVIILIFKELLSF